MRRLLVPLLLVTALVPFPTGAAATTLEYEYVSGVTLHVPFLSLKQALCDDPDETCVGGVVFPMSGFNAIVNPSDDLWGSGAAVLLCVWKPGGAEACTAEDATDGPGCGAQQVTNVPYLAERGVVHVYAVHVTTDLDFCGATQGELHLTLY